jgi:enamine deaminase RidA (YjgF/YER057c/UK114 family)
MKGSFCYALLAATCLAAPAWAQGGGFGRGGMGGLMGAGRYVPSAPKLPGAELEGPLDTAMATSLLDLSPEQAARYAQAYDSFMVSTSPQRDSAKAAIQKMNERLDAGDRAAAMFYVEQVQDFGKFLKDRQEKFENDLRHFLNGDQVKAYKKWRAGEDDAAERQRRENQVRWEEASYRGSFGGPGRSSSPEIKTALSSPPSVPAPALGAAAVRVGRMLYVTGQLAVDSAGTLVGSDLRTQAARAFANLATVLQAAGATPRDVTTLTIFVVNYRPEDLATIRDAGAAFFGPNPPIATALGVQSLGRDGALISVSATASGGRP